MNRVAGVVYRAIGIFAVQHMYCMIKQLLGPGSGIAGA
jgi:hypothetical protein